MAAFGFALAFETSLSLQEMVERLNLQNARWKWVEWQNDKWGDYVRGIAKTNGDPSFKILYDDDINSWALNTSYDHQARAEMDEIVETKILPSLGATNVKKVSDDYSS
ncbi:MAG: hypothetical protein ABJE66_36395 [Deltaproteobacteria bacterium]